MGFIAGDVEEINIAHEDVGNVTLSAIAGEEFNIDYGGYRSEDNADMVATNGQMIDKMSRKRWSVEGPIAWDNVTTDELDLLTQMSANAKLSTITVSHVSGSVFSGEGKPVGDMVGSLGNAQVPLKLAGGGKMKKIA